MKQRNIVCGQDAEFLCVAAGDTIRLRGFIDLHFGNVNSGPGSVVGIATGYGLDGPGIEW
jgi:hypothetical protein